jgi:hypothetical protein
MIDSFEKSLILAIQQEFGDTICGGTITTLQEGIIHFVIETEVGRLGLALTLSEEHGFHTVEVNLSFLSSEEHLHYYDFSELDGDGLLAVGSLQARLRWGNLTLFYGEDIVRPLLYRIDLLPVLHEMQELNVQNIMNILTFMCNEGIFLLPSIVTLSDGEQLTEKDIENSFAKPGAMLQ